MALKEAALRDQLKDRLDLIEPGLQLVADEFYLRNPDRTGTGGFLDILARDSAGRLVVIELKVSKHSEREALTELFKYLALLKANTATKDSEIRLIVISTDWRELRLPFAEFHWHTTYNSVGLLLEVDENGLPRSLRPIELPEKMSGRYFVPRHWLQVYKNKDNRDRCARRYRDGITARGLRNFVLLMFCFDYTGTRQYGFYFAQQREALDFHKQILRSAMPQRVAEIEECAREMSDADDVLNEFADAVTETINIPGDERQIGHPEKLNGYLQRDLWTIERIERSGTFAADLRLTDEQILQDLRGYTGGSHVWYFAASQCADTAHVQEMLDRFGTCLYHNDAWRRQIRDYLVYAQSKGPRCSVLLSIFNPENILETIESCAREGMSSAPSFTLIIEDPDAKGCEVFEGALTADHRPSPDLYEIVRDHFHGKPHLILGYSHLHMIHRINRHLMAHLGLAYGCRYTREQQGVVLEEFIDPVVRGSRIKSGDGRPRDSFLDWMRRNTALVDSLCRFYSSRRVGLQG